MAPLEDYKSTLDTYKPTFMCMAGNTAFLANGTDKIIIYDTQEKKTTTFKPRSPIDCISCLAPIKNHDVIKIDTPDIFCSATNCYIIDNTHAEPQTAPIYLKHIYPSQKHKLFLSCMTNTADPSLFCGIKGNKNELLLLQVSGENIKIQPITIPASIESEPIQLENALGLRTIGCRIFVRLSDQNFITVVPYVPNELIKIHFCEFSCAQAAMLYRVIQDKKNETTIASAEEHKAVQELIPDAYAKTLQKE
jgi:hypothetical protein